jgi:tetratricopeptide (TPR) repeat protein
MLKKVVSILICVLSLFLGVAVAVPENPPADINDLLKKAGDLKVAEKYEAAQDLYEQVLALDPGNREALRGKDDCRVMLEPLIPEQALAVPFNLDDPEWRKIQKAADEAKTPWDRRRASLALKRFARKYTGQVYARDKEAYMKRADEILQEAAARMGEGAPRETVCSRAREKLTVLQEEIHHSWKGHGPDILAPALEKLDKIQKGGGSDSGYRLIKVIKNADLDYGMLNNIDRITPPFPEGSQYQIGDIGTVKGAYTVYKFVREYEGLSGSVDQPAHFHDLLAVKVDDAGVIVDAYKYTLEWTDSPSLALYRLGRKGVRFKEDMDVRELQLTK